MARRDHTSDLLAALGMEDPLLARARDEGQQSAGAAHDLGSAIIDAFGIGGDVLKQGTSLAQKHASDVANANADAFAAEHASDVGHNLAGQGETPYYGETAAEAAQKAVGGDARFSPAEHPDPLQGVIDYFSQAPAARAKAKTSALSRATSAIEKNRGTAKTDALAAQARAQAEADKAAEIGIKQQTADAAAGKAGATGLDHWIPVAEDHPWAVPADVWAKLYPDGRAQPKSPPPKATGAGAVAKATTPDLKALAELQGAEKKLAALDAVIRDKANFNTGPIADAAASIAGTVLPQSIYDPSDRNAWKAKVQRAYNDVLKTQAGSAVSPSEETRQKIAQLNTSMDDSTFDKVAQDIRDSYAQDVADARERLTPSSRREAAGAPAAAADAARQQAANAAAPRGQVGAALGVGPKIRVRRKSDGVEGTIPASNFNPALYERVQ